MYVFFFYFFFFFVSFVKWNSTLNCPARNYFLVCETIASNRLRMKKKKDSIVIVVLGTRINRIFSTLSCFSSIVINDFFRRVNIYNWIKGKKRRKSDRSVVDDWWLAIEVCVTLLMKIIVMNWNLTISFVIKSQQPE